MSKEEFEKWVADKRATVGMWSIESNKKSLKPFTMGCYYDDQEKSGRCIQMKKEINIQFI